MCKLFLRLLIFCAICVISSSVLGARNISKSGASKLKRVITQEITTSQNAKIECGSVKPLIFSGISESQIGNVTFTVSTQSDCRALLVTVTGSSLSNETSSLATEYRPENAQVWYKAGDPFTMKVASGQTNTIQYRVTIGPRISSQHFGTFAAKLSFLVVSNH